MPINIKHIFVDDAYFLDSINEENASSGLTTASRINIYSNDSMWGSHLPEALF